MRGTSTLSKWGDPFRIAIALTGFVVGACGAGDTRLDPSDLELRDLLGMSPEAAMRWDAEQRTAARRVIATGLDETDEARTLTLANGQSLEERVARTLLTLDAKRRASGADAVGVVRVAVGEHEVTTAGRAAQVTASIAAGAEAPEIDLSISEHWDRETTWAHLPGRGLDLLAGLAVDAGHASGPVVIVPGTRLPVIASYIEGRGAEAPRLVVNPVLLAALDPDPREAEVTAGLDRTTITVGSAKPFAVPAGVGGVLVTGVSATDPTLVVIDPGNVDPLAKSVQGTTIGEAVVPELDIAERNDIGNPYSFYGSLAECSNALLARCQRCLPNSSCDPITNTGDGNFECQRLAENEGRGYGLLCANLAVTIASVDRCIDEQASSCPRVYDAASDLSRLEANAIFIDDSTCGNAMDRCLTDIYGAPDPDDGPRRLDVSCGDSCDSNNCEANPSCNCEGPSCNNSFSCDSACSSSNNGGSCGDCSDDGGSSGGGGGGGGCNDSSSSSGGSDNCGSCDDSGGSSGGCSGGDCGGSCDSGGSSGGSSGGGDCGGGCDSGGSSGGSSGGGSCGGGGGGGDCGGGGGSCGGGGGGGCSGGGGGGGGCQVAKRGPGVGLTLAVSAMWGLMPVFAAVLVKRRSRRKAGAVVGNDNNADDNADADNADNDNAAANDEVADGDDDASNASVVRGDGGVR